MDRAIIDAHVHVCVLDEATYPFVPLLGYTPKAAAPVEALIARMDAVGIERAVLVQPSYYAYDNAYLLAALRRFPDRLAGVALADPEAPAFPPACAGVRLNAIGHPGPGWLSAVAAAGFWAAAGAAGLTVCVQCAADQVREVVAVAAAHPEVPCVIDHLGRGAWAALIEAAALPHAHLKVSGMAYASATPYPHRDVWPNVLAAVEAFGPRRCLWGSDANGTTVEPCRAQLALWRELLPLDPEARTEILGGTAARLFFGAPDAGALRPDTDARP